MIAQKSSDRPKKVIDEIIDHAVELPVENQEILLMMAKAMQYTRSCENRQETEPT